MASAMTYAQGWIIIGELAFVILLIIYNIGIGGPQ